jgi:hypothetical protein
MAWMIALAAMLAAIAAGVIGMFTHNTPMFIAGWVASFVAVFALIGALWRMLLGVRRDRLRDEAAFGEENDGWRED